MAHKALHMLVFVTKFTLSINNQNNQLHSKKTQVKYNMTVDTHLRKTRMIHIQKQLNIIQSMDERDEMDSGREHSRESANWDHRKRGKPFLRDAPPPSDAPHERRDAKT